MAETTHQKQQRGNRILYMSDPSTIARTVLPDPVRERDLCKWVDMIADSGIDIFNQEVFSQGWTVYWQSEHYEYDQRPQHQRFRPLIETLVCALGPARGIRRQPPIYLLTFASPAARPHRHLPPHGRPWRLVQMGPVPTLSSSESH